MRRKLPILVLALIILLQAFVPAVYAASKIEAISSNVSLCPFDTTSKGAGKVAKIGDDIGNLGKMVKNPNLNVNWGSAREHALNRMSKNGVTQDMFESWVKNGKAIQQDSNTYLFLTKDGVAVVSKNGIPQTAYTSAQFKDHIIDAITQVYGK